MTINNSLRSCTRIVVNHPHQYDLRFYPDGSYPLFPSLYEDRILTYAMLYIQDIPPDNSQSKLKKMSQLLIILLIGWLLYNHFNWIISFIIVYYVILFLTKFVEIFLKIKII